MEPLAITLACMLVLAWSSLALHDAAAVTKEQRCNAGGERQDSKYVAKPNPAQQHTVQQPTLLETHTTL